MKPPVTDQASQEQKQPEELEELMDIDEDDLRDALSQCDVTPNKDQLKTPIPAPTEVIKERTHS